MLAKLLLGKHAQGNKVRSEDPICHQFSPLPRSHPFKTFLRIGFPSFWNLHLVLSLSLSRVCACTQTHTHSLTRWNMENSEWWGYFFHITYFPVEVWERWEGQRVTERAGLWCQTNPLLNSAWCDPVRDTAWTSVPLKLLRAISVLETMSVKYLRRHLITLRMKSGLCDSML